MSHYPSAAAFLSDVRLRLDALGRRKLGVLIVEGPNDRRLFFRHVVAPSQIMPTSGRTLLLAAYADTTEHDRERMIFVTDCDYEVRRGVLAPSPSLVISEGTDVESDLVQLGLLEGVVGELVPEALVSDDRVAEIADSALRDAVKFAHPLGRIRMAAQPLGVPLNLEKIRHRQYWPNRRGDAVDVKKMIRTTHQVISKELDITLSDWQELVHSTPDDNGMCHGKDLIRAFRFSLGQRHNIGNDVEDETISRLLRAGLWPSRLEVWSVAKRIRQWEAATGRQIFVQQLQ
jgi:hypothetical protein